MATRREGIMVEQANSRRDFIRSGYSGTPSTAAVTASSSDNIVFFSSDGITAREWIEIKALPCRTPYENEPHNLPRWMAEPGTVKYPPNRAQRRAMKKGKHRGSR